MSSFVFTLQYQMPSAIAVAGVYEETLETVSFVYSGDEKSLLLSACHIYPPWVSATSGSLNVHVNVGVLSVVQVSFAGAVSIGAFGAWFTTIEIV